jgi:putative SOS response-associated peptidase YedK
MNGRIAITLPPSTLGDSFGVKANPSDLKKFYSEPQYNLAPSSFLPLITNEQPDRLKFFKWGLIPSWGNTSKNTKGLASIDSTAIVSKPAYSQAFKAKRCLVPCSGFYLWKESAAGKIPYYVKHKVKPFFLIGGIWESTEDELENGLSTFSLITRKPSGLLSFFNQEIPFVIKDQPDKKWLSTDVVDDSLLALSNVMSEADFEYYPVNRKILKSTENDPRFNQKVSYLVAEQTNLF